MAAQQTKPETRTGSGALADRAVGIAHDDVADAHGGATILGAFDCVPPTSTAALPKFSSMAEASHGVTTSSWMGPLDSLHHKPRQASPDAATAPAPIATRRST